MADYGVQVAVVAALESSLLPWEVRECQDDAKMMEDVLFSCDGAERTVAMIRYFKYQKAIAEVLVARSQMSNGKQDRVLYYSKEDKLNFILV